jgi:hypothetical protein
MRGVLRAVATATLTVLLSLVGNLATNTVTLSAAWTVVVWLVLTAMAIATVLLAIRQRRIDHVTPVISAPAPTPQSIETTNITSQALGPVAQAQKIDKIEYNVHVPAPMPVAVQRVQVGVIPPRADGFQDRDVLTDIAAAGAGSTAVLSGEAGSRVLSGLGGVGKTQLAAEHARTLWNRREVDLVLWIEATTRDAIVSSYAAAASTVLGSSDDDTEAAARRWIGWLASTDTRWLVVLDDVQDPAHLRGLWPPHTSDGRSVLTTRRRDAALHGDTRTVIDIGLFTPEEANAFLTHRLQREPAQMRGAPELAKALGYLPLALSQAAAYIADHYTETCTTYLRRFSDQHTALEQLLPDDSGLPDDYRLTVAATWSLSIKLADELAPIGVARPLLTLCSMLDPNGIPDAVITAPATLTHLSTATGRAIDADSATEALSCLHRLSLATHTPNIPNLALRIHALVQRATRDVLTSEQFATIARIAADSLVDTWPEIERDPAFGAVLRANATNLFQLSGTLLHESDAHALLFRAGQSLGETGQVNAAVNYFRQFTETMRDQPGPDHPSTLNTRGYLAYWRGEAGDPAGAATAFDELLTDRLRVLGPDHPATLTTRHNLAYRRGEAGDPAGAATAFDELLTDYLRVLGPDHPATLTTRHNLARWRRRAGDPAGATAALNELLTDYLRVLGPDHPHTLTTRHNLAHWRGEAGDPAGATAALNELLTDYLRVLGPDHPHTLTTRQNIANWRGEAGDPAGAATAFDELLTDRLRVLGPDHPHTLTTRHNLAHWRKRVTEASD